MTNYLNRSKRQQAQHARGPWVYVRSEPQLWTVGFYDPAEKWHSDSDHPSRELAAHRVHYLNGGESDAKPSWSMTALALVRDLQLAQTAIAKAERR
jgi:hypothetical protein